MSPAGLTSCHLTQKVAVSCKANQVERLDFKILSVFEIEGGKS